MTIKERMIEEFQCPGCACGSNTKCGAFKLEENYGFRCSAHAAGTRMSFIGKIALGLPKGFNRYGESDKMHISFWEKGKSPEFNQFNVPVWAMDKDGFLFIRMMCPRINVSYVHVIEGGKFSEVCPNTIDVGKFIDDID